jgi:uncharacterized protein YgiM (DUF1202 family)
MLRLLALVLVLSACNLANQTEVARTAQRPPRDLPTQLNTLASDINPRRATATSTPQPTTTPMPTTRPISIPISAPKVFVINQRAPYPVCSLVPSGSFDVNIRQSPSTSGAVIGTLPTGTWVSASQFVNGWYQISLSGTVVDGGWVSSTVTSLTPTCTCGPHCAGLMATVEGAPVCTLTIVSEIANIYSGPAHSFPVIGQARIWDQFTVAENTSGGWWYRVHYPQGQSAWFSYSDIMMGAGCRVSPCAPNCPTEIPQNTPPPPPELLCTVTINQQATLHVGPGPNYTILAQVAAGETFTVLGRSADYGWFNIAYPAILPGNGWVERSMVTLALACPPDLDSLPMFTPPP